MALILQKGLPVISRLNEEGIDVFTTNEVSIDEIIKMNNKTLYRAGNEKLCIDVKIAIVNLMPIKQDAELDLLRRLASSRFNIYVEFIKIKSRESIREENKYVNQFYKTVDDIKGTYFDGVIITGAPVEKMEFEEVDYWEELKEIMDHCRVNSKSTFHICWAAQAGLYNLYNIGKKGLEEKCFGVFEHKLNTKSKIVNNFDNEFYAPHSRHTTVDIEDIIDNKNLNLISYSEDAGVYIVEDNKDVFVMGHGEYDKYTLDTEYKRDLSKGLEICLPKNYYKDDDSNKEPVPRWQKHSVLLFENWIEYYLIS